KAWDQNTPLCVVYAHTDQGKSDAQVMIGGSVPAVQVAGTGGGSVADQGLLPPGKAAGVGLLPDAQGAIHSVLIVADHGLKSPAASPDVIKKLGYDTSKAAPVPARVLSLIPPGGATLDITEATCPIARKAGCAKSQGQTG